MNEVLTLLEEEHIISLRTAVVLDDGNLVSFRLLPKSLESSGSQPKDFHWVNDDSTYLYRHPRSESGEEELLGGHFPVELGVKAMTFELPPRLKLTWSNSGHSVAAYLNGEPWAFIDEQTRKGYSKGILDPSIACQWDEVLFNKVFGNSISKK